MDTPLEFNLGRRGVGTPDCSLLLRIGLGLFVSSGLSPSFGFIERISFLRKSAVNSEHLVLFIRLNSLALETSMNNVRVNECYFFFLLKRRLLLMGCGVELELLFLESISRPICFEEM